MEPVSISGQKFIMHPDKGWIDSKTRQPANPELLSLLNAASSQSGAAAGSRPRISTTVSQISIGQQKFGWDVNNKQWVDVKTKVAADASLQQVLSFASPVTSPIPKPKKLPKPKPPAEPKPQPAPKAKAQAQDQGLRDEEPAKSFSMPKSNLTNTKTVLASMVNSLGSVDFLLKQRFNVGLISGNTITQNFISNAAPTATQQTETSEDSNNMGLLALGGIAGLTAIIATQFKPIKEPLQAVVSVVSGIIGGMNKMFTSIADLGMKNVTPAAPVNTSSASVPAETERGSSAPAASPENKPAPEKQISVPSTPNTSAPAMSSGSTSGGSNAQATSSSSPASKVSQSTPTSASSPAPKSASKGNAVKTKPIPTNNIAALGKWLEESQGLRISGHSQFGGQERGRHAANSDHYKDQALDVNFGRGVNESKDSQAGAKFDDLATQLRAAGYGVMWRTKGHEDHMHITSNRNVGSGMSGDEQGPLKSVGSMLYDSLGAFMSGIRAIGSTDTSYVPMGSISTDAAQKLAMSAITKTADIIAVRTKKVVPQVIAIPPAPNVSQGSGTVRTTATSEDKAILDQYLKYFDVSAGPIPTYINS